MPSTDFIHSCPSVEAWTIRLDDPGALPDAMMPLLAPDERERADSFRNDTARRRYILSHAALRQILATHLNQPAAEIIFEAGTNGKPSLAASSQSRLEFNLSHSGTIALVAVSLSAQVGIDVEALRPMRDAVAVAKRFFTQREAAAIEQLPEPERSTTFFNLWTRKEAFVKATGQGIADALSRFEVSWDSRATLLSVDGDTGQAAQWSLHSFAPATGFLAAVAVHAAESQLARRKFEWR